MSEVEHDKDDDLVEENNMLEMSDEDIMNFDPSTLVVQAPVVEEDPADKAGEGEPEGGDEPAGEEAEPEGEAEPAAVKEDEQEGEPAPVVKDEKPVKEDEPAAEPKDKDEKPKESMDYKAEFEKVLAPFNANGKQIQVQSAEEAVSLMQMGANYNKKMAALKPNLKLLKLLENNGLLSEEKLSFLIDLDKKNPDAISKLIKDSGLDPLEMDVSKSEYKPKTYTVDDRELELDSVLDKIQDTPTFRKTLDVVSNKWDGPSKQIVAGTPQLIEVINGHMQSGVFDLINTEVERERMLGRLNGMSDIEAYRHVGEVLHNRGVFNATAKSEKKPAEREPIAPKPKVDDSALRAKKLAASTPKAAAPVKQDSDFNPLALSDEDFAKIGNPRQM